MNEWMNECETLVELNWERKIELLWEKPVPMVSNVLLVHEIIPIKTRGDVTCESSKSMAVKQNIAN
jgi:hypothetical protein